MTLQRALFLSLVKSQKSIQQNPPSSTRSSGWRKVWWRSRHKRHCCFAMWTHRDNKETLHSTITLETFVLSFNTVCQPAVFSISPALHRCLCFLRGRGNQPHHTSLSTICCPDAPAQSQPSDSVNTAGWKRRPIVLCRTEGWLEIVTPCPS